MKKLLSHIKFNAPVTLGFVMVCGIALLLDHITGGLANRHLFSTYRSGLLNPMTYVRAFGYTVGHADWAHFTANMTYILLLGPLVEEKYGSRNLLEMMGITAVVTAIFHALLSSNVALLGASGIVFMLIILSSISNVKSGEIPITFIIVCIIFIGGQILDSFHADNISQLGHIVGGICGGCFGLFMIGHEKEGRSESAGSITE
ncbi:MAG: rhomboid family intramembrane serine protease [Lachnospiraceae bacterium]|nr:rhomboid family intramembrane serine protease [Lachnospiraceae bacterium]